jgi:hypothetical protein
MRSRSRPSATGPAGRLARRLAVGAAAVLLVAGCSSSGDGGTPAGGSSAASGSSGSSGTSGSASPYLPVPAGVDLTPPGTELSVGDHAVVAYHPRRGRVAALDIAVTRLERAPLRDFSAWQLSKQQQASTPFYVRARVSNVGETPLGGRPVPLYVVNEDDVLLESTPFASSFSPCPSTAFPRPFAPGDTANVCLVYLAPDHGRLVAVSFRPDESFDPITWTGTVERRPGGRGAKAPRG